VTPFRAVDSGMQACSSFAAEHVDAAEKGGGPRYLR
jgi:hypothetical protein